MEKKNEVLNNQVTALGRQIVEANAKMEKLKNIIEGERMKNSKHLEHIADLQSG